jgi:hypothetical protein
MERRMMISIIGYKTGVRVILPQMETWSQAERKKVKKKSFFCKYISSKLNICSQFID